MFGNIPILPWFGHRYWRRTATAKPQRLRTRRGEMGIGGQASGMNAKFARRGPNPDSRTAVAIDDEKKLLAHRPIYSNAPMLQVRRSWGQGWNVLDGGGEFDGHWRGREGLRRNMADGAGRDPPGVRRSPSIKRLLGNFVLITESGDDGTGHNGT
jgi:hypothetical protein